MEKESNDKIKAVFDEYAASYAKKYEDLSRYERSFSFFENYIVDENARILELGCGPGNVIQFLLKKQPEWSFTGIDFSSEMIRIAMEKFPNHSFFCQDALDYQNDSVKYDGVLVSFLFPYLELSEIHLLMENLTKMIAPRGIVYLSTMIAEVSESIDQFSSDGKQHLKMHFYNQSTILSLLSEYGFDILFTESIPALNEKDTDGIFIAQKRSNY